MPTDATIQPDENGRWPAEFLNAQLQRIEAEIETLRTISKSNLATIVENSKTLNPQASLIRETAVSLVDMSTGLLAKLLTAKDFIEGDKRSASGAHCYGRCWTCEERGASKWVFLKAARLFAQPSADICCRCQEKKEEAERAK